MPLELIWFAVMVAVALPVFGLLCLIREAEWGGEAVPPVSILIAFVCSLLVAVIVAKGRDIEERQHQATERGYALYCPLKGEFAWKGECEQRGEE